MNLPNAVQKAFASRDITNLKTFYKKVNSLTKKHFGKEAIEDAIDNYFMETPVLDIAIKWDADKIIYREKLFRNTHFKIDLTEREYQEQKLYIGHRFVPFLGPEIPFSAIQLQGIVEPSPELQKEILSLMEAFQYVSLLPPYAVNYPKMPTTETVELYYYDLSEWIEANDFQEKDAILVVPIDYDQYIFRLEKLTSRHLAEQTFITQHKDQNLTESFEDVLNWYPDPMPADLSLFWAFALSKSNVVEKPGSSIGQFVSFHEDLTLHTLAQYPFIHFHEYQERILAESFENEPYDMFTIGEATDLNGIFRELANSYTENFIAGKLIHQLHQNQQINKKEIITLLFKGSRPFEHPIQEKNFHKAFNQLAKDIERQWKKKKLPLPTLRLLGKALELRTNITLGLRSIAQKAVDAEDLDLDILNHLQYFDVTTDNILESIVQLDENGELQVTPDDAVDIISQVEIMQNYCREGIEHMLNQL